MSNSITDPPALDEAALRIISEHPLDDYFDDHRGLFDANSRQLLGCPATRDMERYTETYIRHMGNLALIGLQSAPAAPHLLATSGPHTVDAELDDILTYFIDVKMDLDLHKDLLRVTLVDQVNDISIWAQVYKIVRAVASQLAEARLGPPPPQPNISLLFNYVSEARRESISVPEHMAFGDTYARKYSRNVDEELREERNYDYIYEPVADRNQSKAKDISQSQVEDPDRLKKLIIDEVIYRSKSLVGRATTCWLAHPDREPGRRLVIKDSWQCLNQGQEGELLLRAARYGVKHVARYYHHEIVQVNGRDDDVLGNVRGGLDTTKGNLVYDGDWNHPSQLDWSIPDSCRPKNRLHHRVIVEDYGEPLYKCKSLVSLLKTLEACIDGHRSLYHIGIVHRDISLDNVMMTEDETSPNFPGFLIDLDLALDLRRPQPWSRFLDIVGTQPYIATRLLLEQDKHSFMHDLESFFWVLFWICIHYENGEPTAITEFDWWKTGSMESLGELKSEYAEHDTTFNDIIETCTSSTYRPLIPWLKELRKVVFPENEAWTYEDEILYDQMLDVLRRAQEDDAVKAIGPSASTSHLATE